MPTYNEILLQAQQEHAECGIVVSIENSPPVDNFMAIEVETLQKWGPMTIYNFGIHWREYDIVTDSYGESNERLNIVTYGPTPTIEGGKVVGYDFDCYTCYAS
ncbi:MAG: hypothetical protein GY721_13550 [Deltaproteobacteria bacterium]|jgi:hypothetical protein|nr:hypothetical protein [Deltaproteobacteria bacterium]